MDLAENNTGWDKTPMPMPEYDVYKVPEWGRRLANYQRTKWDGNDVLESIAQGTEYTALVSEEAKEIAEETAQRQDAVEAYNTALAQEMTDKDVISAPEIIQARSGKATLGSRLDASDRRMDGIEINVLDYGAVGDGVADDTQVFDTAIDTAVLLGGKICIPKGYTFRISINRSVDNMFFLGGGHIKPANDTHLMTLTGDRNTISDIVVEVDMGVSRPVSFVGDYNVLENAVVYRPEKLPTDTPVSYTNALVSFTGDYNLGKNNDVFNGFIGILTAGRHNEILSNHVHDNITGVQQSSRNRHTIIDSNIIVDNNVSHWSGADGILVTRNASGLKITRNTILNSGEHGIYFQGDSSVITDNIVSDNYGSGIKLASYTDGLYFYDDETVPVEYFGKDNVISRNVCKGNGLTGVNAGIYLQSALKNITVSDNILENNAFGIRSVTTGRVNEDLTIVNNQSNNNMFDDYSIICHSGLLVSGNSGGRMLIAGGTDGATGDGALISSNKLSSLSINNQTHSRVVNNTVDDLSINTNNVRVSVKDNVINNLKILHLDRIVEFVGNSIVFDENGKITSSPYGQIDNFSGNTLSFKAIDYPDAISFGTGTRSHLKFDDNRFVFESLTVPAILIYMNFSSMSNNSFSGTITSQSIATIRGNNNNISGNRSSTSVEIGMTSGVDNIFTNNQMIVGYAGTTGIKNNNRTA